MQFFRIPRHGAVTLGTLAILVAGLAACANPAANKPVAQVGDAKDVAATGEAPTEDTRTFTISEGSKLSWVGSKVTGSHDGGFNTFSGRIELPNDDITGARIQIDIDTTSIWSDTDRLTSHLKSADFFEVETYPTATFTSTGIEAADAGYEVTGNLTMHGVTKSITFPAEIELSGDTLTATAEFVIDRTDFEINYKGKADDLIRSEVVISFDITANA